MEDNSVTNILLMNKENFALKLVEEIILYYNARSKKHRILGVYECFNRITVFIVWLELNAISSIRLSQREYSESWKSYKFGF